MNRIAAFRTAIVAMAALTLSACGINSVPTKEEAAKAKSDLELYGINHRVVDGAEFAQIEPDLKEKLAGAIHWTDPWTVRDPGALVAKYFELYKSMAHV